MTKLSQTDGETTSDQIRRLAETGQLELALEASLGALDAKVTSEDLFEAAATAWAYAVEKEGALHAFGPDRLDALHRKLIVQQGCDTNTPIFSHYIAAQHSSGQQHALRNAARALSHTLHAMLASDDVPSNAVVLALLLRSELPVALQERLSVMHKAHFANFSEGQLRIPYSVIFDRRSFSRNVRDLEELAVTCGENLVDGHLSLVHVLLLLWLTPSSFADLEEGWHLRAIDARKHMIATEDERRAARTLYVRYGGSPDPDLDQLSRRFKEDQARVWSEVAPASIQNEAALAKLNSLPWHTANATLNMVVTKTGLSVRRNRPKVAVCISGQLRGFRKAWPTWKPLLSGADVTVFVHTWKNVGRGTAEPFRYNLPFEGENFIEEYRKIGLQQGLPELQSRYPAFFGALRESGQIDSGELQEFYGTSHVCVDDENEPQFAGFTNPEKMYWKTEKCFELMEESGKHFDLVVRIRPDKPILAVGFSWTNLMKAVKHRPLLLSETAFGVHYGALLMGDQFAIGLPQVSSIYARTYSRMQKPMEVGLYKLEKALSGHSTFAQSCWLSDVDVVKAPVKFGKFQEAERMPAQAVKNAIQQDVASRMDALDQRFLAALQKDCAA